MFLLKVYFINFNFILKKLLIFEFNMKIKLDFKLFKIFIYK